MTVLDTTGWTYQLSNFAGDQNVRTIVHGIAAKAKGLEPFQDNVLIIRDENDDKIGGILLPDVAQQRPCRGTVVAVGPGKINAETGEAVFSKHWAEIGDHVLFTKYGGVEVTHCGQDFLMVSQEHLLARIPIERETKS